MPRKANEILVEWLESKDQGTTNRVNVKHIIANLEEIAVGDEIVVKLYAKRYRGRRSGGLPSWASLYH